MSSGSDSDITRLLRDLAQELKRLQREIEPGSSGGLSSPETLSRFTSEVAIPGVILMLQTQIRALELLRRTIRLADGRDPRGLQNSAASEEVKLRAEQLGQATLSGLDRVLDEVQQTLNEQDDDDATQLLEEARQLQNDIQEQLGDRRGSDADGGTEIEINNAESDPTDVSVSHEEDDPVDIDVEAELRSLKDNLEDDGTKNADSDEVIGAPDDSGEDPDSTRSNDESGGTGEANDDSASGDRNDGGAGDDDTVGSGDDNAPKSDDGNTDEKDGSNS